MAFNFYEIINLKKEYRNIVNKINNLNAWEFVWDYGFEDNKIPIDGPQVIDIAKVNYEREQILINLVMSNGILVTDNKGDDFIIQVIADTEEEAFKIAKDMYKKRFYK